MADILFVSFLFFIAILYSSVGHGGASGYLALMVIFNFAPEIIRPTALLLNIFVSSIALVAFYKNGHLKFKLLLPFVITSIPLSYIGGTISINPKIYKIILGIFLIIAIARMIYRPKNLSSELKKTRNYLALLIGAFLGFFSGLIGIGGGIILSPIILLLGWANVKETSAVSAAFIMLNSISGLSGQYSSDISFAPEIFYMLTACILGGAIGAHIGSFRASDRSLRYTLSIVLIFASAKLIML